MNLENPDGPPDAIELGGMAAFEDAYKKRNLDRSIRDAAPDMLVALQAIDALVRSVAASKDAVLELTRPAIHKALHGASVIKPDDAPVTPDNQRC